MEKFCNRCQEYFCFERCPICNGKMVDPYAESEDNLDDPLELSFDDENNYSEDEPVDSYHLSDFFDDA